MSDDSTSEDDPDEVSPTGGIEELARRVDELETSVSELDDAFDAKIRDVRERVIQVKRETDGKAPLDHDHSDLEEGLQRIDDDLAALGDDVADLDADRDRIEGKVDDVDDRVRRGFSNYEEVLEYLIDVTDDLNRKIDTLARGVVAARERVGRLESARASRDVVDRLRESGQVHGVSEAKCEDCGGPVDLGLLTGPDCPHCEASFSQLEPSTGLFRSSVLRTGRRPALEGGFDRDGPDLDAIVAEETDAPPAVNVPISLSEEPAPEDGSSGGGPLQADGSTAEEVPDGPTGVDDDGEHVGRDAAGHATRGDRSVDEVPGIGSAYADRLRDAGVETLGALARADPDRLADRTDVAPGRVAKWVRRARGMDETDGVAVDSDRGTDAAPEDAR